MSHTATGLDPLDRILSVADGGFSRLGKPREAWLKHREENACGWRSELDAATAYVEGR